ncbi:MAG: hypothetical protein PHO08_14315 [Methylococcales bacterium]|nr:hypothetical protein [Methylococcales bacterium]
MDYDRAMISWPIACISLQRKIKVAGLIREALDLFITLSLGTHGILIWHRCRRHSWSLVMHLFKSAGSGELL